MCVCMVNIVSFNERPLLLTDLAQINSKDIPFISGIRDKYNVNDTISLNCTTTAIKADLSWFINGKKVSNSGGSPLCENTMRNTIGLEHGHNTCMPEN